MANIKDIMALCLDGATYYALDKKTLDKAPLSFKEKMLLKVALKAVKGTDIELLLRSSGLIK